jgi:HEAT repeat protein
VKPDAGLVRDLKDILQQVVAAPRQYAKGFLERRSRQIRSLRGEDWLAALDRAVGRSVLRKRALAELLAGLTDLPEVVDRFAAWLRDPDTGWRAEMIAFVGNKGLLPFAPLLNDALAGNGGDGCLAYAMTSAGQLRSEANLKAILKLAADPKRKEWSRLLWALKDYGHPRCRPALRRVFRRAKSKHERVIAAWGLGKLGDERAIRYLADMLDDPAVETPTSHDPGESIRAAQALCDIHGWPFEWDHDWVAGGDPGVRADFPGRRQEGPREEDRERQGPVPLAGGSASVP